MADTPNFRKGIGKLSTDTIFYIYKITNLQNNKIYIGKTNDVDRRWQMHKIIAKGGLEKYKVHFNYIHAAILKYGEDNFKIEIINKFCNEDEAYKAEEQIIKKFNSSDREFGYNLSAGGKGVMSGRPVSLETREKISKFNKGKKKNSPIFSDNAIKKMSFKSKNNKGLLTIDQKYEIINIFDSGNFTKRKIAEIFNVTYETIKYVIVYGKKYGFKTDEELLISRKKMANKKRGKKLTEKHIKNVSKSLKGIVFSKERCENISKSLKGKIISQEVRDKIAAKLYKLSIEEYTKIKKEIIEAYKNNNKIKIKKLSNIFNLNTNSIRKIIKTYKELND